MGCMYTFAIHKSPHTYSPISPLAVGTTEQPTNTATRTNTCLDDITAVLGGEIHKVKHKHHCLSTTWPCAKTYH